MIALIWQTALLLLGAYFLGAIVACLIRRTFFVLAPKSRVAPALPSQDDAAARFQRALTGEGAAVAGGPAAMPADRSAALLAAARSVGAAARMGAPRPVAGANAQTAAALSAAAATAERRQPGPPEQGLAVALPAASGTPAQAAVTGQVTMPSPRVQPRQPPIVADDLTRIRGIDRALETRLHALGVRSFAQIAAWRAEDVGRFGAELNAKGRIAQENWIEQAQVLAGGGETSYSRRIAQRERPSAEPAPELGERPSLPLAGAGAAAAAAAALKGKDNLQRIAGIDGDLERRLNAEGVERYSQIAAWSGDEAARFDRQLGLDGRIARDYWIEQAQILGRGSETAFSRALDRLNREGPRPVSHPEAVDRTAAKVQDSARQPRGDISRLRSVKSEAYRAAEGATSLPSAATGSGAARGADDLKRIRGIGVLIEKRLNAMAITRYEQIAHWTAEYIERVSNRLDFKGRIERENWIEQARILASGGQTEFSRRVDRGDVEKRE
jgi:predicted flap endonuclease-1-like 5' DNA nuclease